MYSHYEIWAIAQERRQQVLKDTAQRQQLNGGAANSGASQQFPGAHGQPDTNVVGLIIRQLLMRHTL